MNQLAGISTVDDSPPRGVVVEQSDDGTTKIEFQLTSNRWAILLMVLMIGLLASIVVVSLILVLRSPEISGDSSVALRSIFGLSSFLLVLTPLVLWHRLNKTTIRFGADELIFTFRWCWTSKTVVVPRSQIKQIVQWQSDGWPVRFWAKWSLKLEGKHSVLVIGGDGYESSFWLGQRIAQWARVPYESAVKDW